MTTRMQILEDAYQNMQSYTQMQPWRPAIVDLCVYDMIIDMHALEDIENPEYMWKDTPDHIMQNIIESEYVFEMDYGLEDLQEQINNYLIENSFIISVDELSDEEYNQLTEGSK